MHSNSSFRKRKSTKFREYHSPKPMLPWGVPLFFNHLINFALLRFSLVKHLINLNLSRLISYISPAILTIKCHIPTHLTQIIKYIIWLYPLSKHKNELYNKKVEELYSNLGFCLVTLSNERGELYVIKDERDEEIRDSNHT